MAVKVIAQSYWRSVKRGSRAFSSVPAGVAEDVRALAQADVESGAITMEQYAELIGEAYRAN